jgi:hypothetical protein
MRLLSSFVVVAPLEVFFAFIPDPAVINWKEYIKILQFLSGLRNAKSISKMLYGTHDVAIELAVQQQVLNAG